MSKTDKVPVLILLRKTDTNTLFSMKCQIMIKV